MLTYNALLYTERKKLNFSRFQMARLLRINIFSYSMIEKGYFKPTKKQAERISQTLEVNYHRYLEGEPSYPSELPEKKRNVVVRFFYKVLGNLVFKILIAVLAGASVGFMISGFAVNSKLENNTRDYFGQEYLTFVDNLKENGSLHLSATGTLTSPEYRYYEKDEVNKTSKLISIVGSYKDNTVEFLSFTSTYRNETSRLIYTLNTVDYKNGSLVAKYTEYESAISVTTTLSKNEKPLILSFVGGDGMKDYYFEENPEYDKYVEKLSAKYNEYIDDFNFLISSKDPTFATENPNKLEHLMDLRNEGQSNMTKPTIYAFVGRYFGIVLSGFFIFVLAYAFIYGTTKKGEKVYTNTKLEVNVDEVHRMKSDIKIMPFVPETLLEIIGIILVFIGSFRLIFYTASYIGSNSAAALNTNTGQELMQTFIVGMFLLYFIDFDIFLDDKRVLRNIVLYSVIFFCLYGLENLLYRVLTDDSIVGQLMTMATLPNMFGSIACYYLIMLFLFYTPKFITKKKHRFYIYRSLSAIPALYIFIAWFLYNGYNVLFTADWPRELRNFFNGEKIPFSILAVTYLFALYGLRSFMVHKYGRDRAYTFFNGNRFLWIKNIMVSVIILIIGIVELCLKENLTAHKLGLGMYWNILFLIPLLLFYHPHKGPRNIILDWTTLFFYILAISFSYVTVIVMVLSRLFL